MCHRILFVPWSKAEAPSLGVDANKFRTNMETEPKTDSWSVVFYNAPSKAFVGLQSTVQIYVLGHGSAGKDFIANRQSGTTILDSNRVCGRLIAMGLAPSFGGTIKFYNCYGAAGKDYGPSMDSFAGNAAKFLRKVHYTSCTIYGYWTEVLSPTYMDGTIQKGYRYRGEEQTDGHPSAKVVRVKFLPGNTFVVILPRKEPSGEVFEEGVL